VLLCRPDSLARSARETGWWVRIRLKTRLRLISRGVLLEALRLPVKAKRVEEVRDMPDLFTNDFAIDFEAFMDRFVPVPKSNTRIAETIV
jgi:hypothetical protein